MPVVICISDFFRNREFKKIGSDNGINDTTIISLSSFKGVKRKVEIDAFSGSYFQEIVNRSAEFRHFLSKYLKNRSIELFWIQIIPPKKGIIDYKWNEMLTRTLWEKIEMDYLLSWLSTLGGGYSALGEHSKNCAKTAGKISLRQLSLGLRIGDPHLQARCKLYYSISLIQIGRLKAAKRLVRTIYEEFAVKHAELDPQLIKMCEGVFLRIHHEFQQKIKEKERKKLILYGSGDK